MRQGSQSELSALTTPIFTPDNIAITVPDNGEIPVITAAHATLRSRICWSIIHRLWTMIHPFRVFVVLTALSGRWLHQLFLQLNHYGVAPSPQVQQTWLSFPVFGANALFTLMIEIANYRHAKKYPGDFLALEDHVFEVFASSIIFFAIDNFMETTQIEDLPLGWFIAITALGIPLAVTFTRQIILTDSSDQIILSLTQLKEFNPPSYPAAHTSERIVNIISSVMKYAIPSVATFFSVLDREENGAQTVPLDNWQIGLIGLYLIFAGKVGYELNEHPKFYQTWAAFSKFLKEGALTAYTMSAVFFLIVVYQCPDRNFCLDADSAAMLDYLNFFISFAVGLYAAATTRVRFQENHESNEVVIQTIKNMPERAREVKNSVVTFFGEISAYLPSCCHRSNNNVHENDALVCETGGLKL